jgi:flagellar biosynthesis/type III secretory pathway protein FliH
VGLPGLKGEQFVAGEHLLGVALTALMDVPPARRAAVHAEALRRLAEARENDYRRYLLLDCLEAYSTLDEAQAQELAALLQTERYQGAQAMPLTSFEKGVQAGLEQGRRMLQKQLQARFGPLSPSVHERLESLSPERLEELALVLLEAHSLQELGLED